MGQLVSFNGPVSMAFSRIYTLAERRPYMLEGARSAGAAISVRRHRRGQAKHAVPPICPVQTPTEAVSASRRIGASDAREILPGVSRR